MQVLHNIIWHFGSPLAEAVPAAQSKQKAGMGQNVQPSAGVCVESQPVQALRLEQPRHWNGTVNGHGRPGAEKNITGAYIFFFQNIYWKTGQAAQVSQVPAAEMPQFYSPESCKKYDFNKSKIANKNTRLLNKYGR